jgi:hypothetical protein
MTARRQTVEQDKLSPPLQFVKSVLLANAGIFAACAVVIWLGGWRTLHDYSNALVLAGSASVCVGAASLSAGWALTRGSEYQYNQPPSSDPVRELVRQALESRHRYYGLMMRMAIIGAIPILVGMLIQAYLA